MIVIFLSEKWCHAEKGLLVFSAPEVQKMARRVFTYLVFIDGTQAWQTIFFKEKSSPFFLKEKSFFFKENSFIFLQ